MNQEQIFPSALHALAAQPFAFDIAPPQRLTKMRTRQNRWFRKMRRLIMSRSLSVRRIHQ